MAELYVGMLADVGFDLFPVSLIITHFFAVSTNRQQALQYLDFIRGLLACPVTSGDPFSSANPPECGPRRESFLSLTSVIPLHGRSTIPSGVQVTIFIEFILKTYYY